MRVRVRLKVSALVCVRLRVCVLVESIFSNTFELQPPQEVRTLGESFNRKRALVKYQSQSEVIQVMLYLVLHLTTSLWDWYINCQKFFPSLGRPYTKAAKLIHHQIQV